MTDDFSISRRLAIQLGLGALAAPSLLRAIEAQKGGPLLRAVPSTGEQLPVIGIGTARGYGTPPGSENADVTAILRRFSELGGRFIDTSPDYGSAEIVLGESIETAALRDKLFLADTVTVATPQMVRAQVDQSLQRLKATKLDLMQLSLAVSTPELFAFARELKTAGKTRYVGVVGAGADRYDELEAVIRREKPDFVQVDMSAEDRRASKRILPAAVDAGAAVILNQPFGHGRLFRHVLGKAIPAWARDFEARSWAQIFLKYLVAQPGVTVVIPGTERLEYVVDNMAATRGKLPNERMQRRIEAVVPAVG